jgi:hypothetical protein
LADLKTSHSIQGQEAESRSLLEAIRPFLIRAFIFHFFFLGPADETIPGSTDVLLVIARF